VNSTTRRAPLTQAITIQVRPLTCDLALTRQPFALSSSFLCVTLRLYSLLDRCATKNTHTNVCGSSPGRTSDRQL
jgi:hypothetical protein